MMRAAEASSEMAQRRRLRAQRQMQEPLQYQLDEMDRDLAHLQDEEEYDQEWGQEDPYPEDNFADAGGSVQAMSGTSERGLATPTQADYHRMQE